MGRSLPFLRTAAAAVIAFAVLPVVAGDPPPVSKITCKESGWHLKVTGDSGDQVSFWKSGSKLTDNPFMNIKSGNTKSLDPGTYYVKFVATSLGAKKVNLTLNFTMGKRDNLLTVSGPIGAPTASVGKQEDKDQFIAMNPDNLGNQGGGDLVTLR